MLFYVVIPLRVFMIIDEVAPLTYLNNYWIII